MNKPKAGLLPLYIELYDRSSPEMRPRIEEFYGLIARELKKRGLDIVEVPVCRLEPEFASAVKTFEEKGTDAIVTLHLAYSPSLESSGVLASTKLPIIVLDTTPAYEFGPGQEEDEISYNHGIHGVQDMCNLLIRNKKDFHLEAGHWEKSDVIDRAAGWVKAAKLASSIRNMRVGCIGEAFKGMGDFAVPREILRSSIGIETVAFDFSKSSELAGEVTEKEISDEMEYNLYNYDAEGLDPNVHRRSAAANLLVRRWILKEKLKAFTVNFLAIDQASQVPCMPFLEASKAMARGIGYAGEGDILTAALVGALMSAYAGTSFTEMFCPDWEKDSVFLSHIGEMNMDLTAEKPVLAEDDFEYTDALNPVVAKGRFKAGRVVFVNLAPVADGAYALITASGEMLEVDCEDKMRNTVHGWFKPSIPLIDFLSEYSKAGGTHHAALVYGQVEDEIVKFGKIMGWKSIRI